MTKRDQTAYNVRDILLEKNKFLTLQEIYDIYLSKFDMSGYTVEGAQTFIRTSIYEYCLDRDLYKEGNELVFFSLSAKGKNGNQYGLIEWCDNDDSDNMDDILSKKPIDVYFEEQANRLASNPTTSTRVQRIRAKMYKLYAFAAADYKCEVDKDHPSFIRKSDLKNYTEPHHLIPLCFQKDFQYSLDVPSNIVSLCSNCHNQLHYGLDKITILKKLYDERIERLKKNNIGITFEQLCKYYNL